VLGAASFKLIGSDLQMTDVSLYRAEEYQLHQKALSSWENEGGAEASSRHELQGGNSEMNNAELVQLRIRVIALENLVITLLAEGSDRQLDVARKMSSYISPRPGFTQHPLTIKAAGHITDLVGRAFRFRAIQS
jgi:hypothetical protein